MKRHVHLLEGIKQVKSVRVILEGKVGKVMKGKKLLEEVEFEDGDDLSVEIPRIVEEYENEERDDAMDLQEGDEEEYLGDNSDDADLMIEDEGEDDGIDPTERALNEGSKKKFGK
jgi:hypothetical protein